MKRWIFVVSGDLRRTADGRIELGPEMRRVCKKAMDLYAPYPLQMRSDQQIVATSGYSPEYGVRMARDVIYHYLKRQLIGWVTVADADAFNTDGEIRKLVEILPEEDTDLFVVCRWWHMPRTFALLKYRLKKSEQKGRLVIRCVPVWNSLDIRGMLREPFAIMKNLFRLIREK